MWQTRVLSLLLVGLVGGFQGCVAPPRASVRVESPPSEDLLHIQAQEDCRFYRLSLFLPRDGEEPCIQRRMVALRTIATLRYDPAFPAAQEACAFFQGSPTEDRCYQRYMVVYPYLADGSCWIPGSWMCRGRPTSLLSPFPP
jgi:hypothetical protein